MAKKEQHNDSYYRFWIFVLFLALLLVLVKLFFISTYYIGDEEVLPPTLRPYTLLIVSTQSSPSKEGDITLLTLPNGELAPALFLSEVESQCKVQIGEKIEVVPRKRVKGKVIGRLLL